MTLRRIAILGSASPGLVCSIDPVVSSTIITSVFEKLSRAAHPTFTGTLVKPKIDMTVVGTSTVATPEIE